MRGAFFLAALGFLCSCAHQPDVPKMDPRPSGLQLALIAARNGVPRCQVSVPISEDQAIRYARRWERVELSTIPEWKAMSVATRPGDQLRQVHCIRRGQPGGNVFFGLFRDGVLVREVGYVMLD